MERLLSPFGGRWHLIVHGSVKTPRVCAIIRIAFAPSSLLDDPPLSPIALGAPWCSMPKMNGQSSHHQCKSTPCAVTCNNRKQRTVNAIHLIWHSYQAWVSSRWFAQGNKQLPFVVVGPSGRPSQLRQVGKRSHRGINVACTMFLLAPCSIVWR